MSRNQRLSFLGIAAVIAVVAIVVLTTGGSGDTSTDDSANTSAQQTATPSGTPTAAEAGDATPTARAFHAADVLDRVLQVHHHARAAAFTVREALVDLELVHASPVSAYHHEVLAAAGLAP